jgi:hypothetical protein
MLIPPQYLEEADEHLVFSESLCIIVVYWQPFHRIVGVVVVVPPPGR